MNIKLLILIVFFFLASTCNVNADDYMYLLDEEYSISIGLYTKHLKTSANLNEQNELFAVQIHNWTISTFNNSHYNRSWFLGYDFDTDKISLYISKLYVRGHFYIGTLYGYGDDLINIDGWSPAAMVTGEIGFNRFSIEGTYLPIDDGVVIIWANILF